MERLEQLPTLSTRSQAFSAVNMLSQQYGSCVVSHVGKAELGTAEQYVKEMRTVASTAYMIPVDVSAAGGVSTICFMQRLTTDIYHSTFPDELHRQGLTFEMADRHALQLPPIADYRNASLKCAHQIK